MKTVTTGSDFSGVGAFDYAIERVSKQKGFKHKRIFACDWDKYARITYTHNHGAPGYYPKDVYDREIPKESLDIYMTSPPCQSFSLAGKRKGKDDERGVLFFNSHEFIKENKPRFFIFENVKGLLSDDNGKTFQEWVNMLGGKSINGFVNLFPEDNSVSYHIYWKVLNSKKYGVPQNRERVFIVGIRDDEDNVFIWPKEERLTKRLKDVLESKVNEKYFLSEKMVSFFIKNSNDNKEKGNGFRFTPTQGEKEAKAITTRAGGRMDDNFIEIKSNTKKGFEEAKEGDSINYSNSKTRRGRVGKGVAQTLDTNCQQGIIQLNNPKHSNNRVYSVEGSCPTLNTMQGGNRQPFCCIPVLTPDRLNKRQNGRRFKEDGDPSFTITTQDRHGIFNGIRIRRLTPRECFRLQDFPDTFDFSVVSDTQAYKQAGNSITVRVLELILQNINI